MAGDTAGTSQSSDAPSRISAEAFGRGYDPVAAARRLTPRIRDAASAIETERRLPSDLVDALRSAGLFHVGVPRSIGGLECDPMTQSRVVEEVAYADGSTGWCVMLAAQSASFAAFIDQAEARRAWGTGGIIAGTARPIGRAIATSEPSDGFIVSGRWPFASGSTHADWFAAECKVYDGDTLRRTESGDEVTRMTLVPASEVSIHDTWHTTGLRGTASNDFSIDGAFVPASRCFQVLVSEPKHPWPVFRAPALTFMNHGAHALGVARAGLEAANEIARTKAGWGGVPLREFTRVQATVAEATVLVDSARTHLYAVAAELHASVTDGLPESLLAARRSRLRLASAYAATSSVRAVDLLHGLTAASAIFQSSPIERVFRDIHTAAAHVMIGPLVYEAAGRVELGMDASFPFF